MNHQASIFRLFAGGLKFVIYIISKIFNHLASNDIDTLNDRNVSQNLYNAAYVDEIKYQDYCDRDSIGDFDPEEKQLPM